MAIFRRVSVGVMSMSVVSCAVLSVAACSSGSSSSASSGSGTSSASTSIGSASGTYNWGIDAELSGVVSYYGLSIKQGVEAYVSQVNAAGGINGHKIKLTSLDSAGNQSQGAADATQLASADQVDAIFGNALSSDCTGAQSAADRYQVPLACLSVDTPDPYVFSLGADNSTVASALVAAGQKVSGKKSAKAAFVYLNTLTDIALAKSITSVAKGAGASIAASQEISLTATDVSAQVAEVVAAKPDVVLISETGPGLLSVLKGVRAAGITAPFVWVDGTGNLPALAQSTDTGVYAMNVYQVVQPGATEAGAQDYISAVTPTIKGTPTVESLNSGETVPGYMTARAFGAALKSCGYPCSGAQLKTALEKLNVSLPGLVASYAFTPSNHYPYTNWYVYHAVGTKTTLVDTLPAGTGS
jgi:branched-chain amino acid transport system substrate-binding protein